MRRKVFISVLGTGIYNQAKYQLKDLAPSKSTRFIQEATLESLGAKEWSENDIALILLTTQARSENWNETVIKRNGIQYEGLSKVLRDMQLPINIIDEDIPNGKDEKELWEIFRIIYSRLQTGDELYFDLTHSFRYLPMLLLVLASYAKFLKSVSIKSVTYGNYEMGQTTDCNGISPIVDLLPLSLLQDWTFAAGQFFDTSNIKKMMALTKEQIVPMIKEKGSSEAKKINAYMKALEKLINDRVTCRGLDIISSVSYADFIKKAEEIDNTFIAPLNPILEKVKDAIGDYDLKENVLNGFKATKWCYDNGYYQQTITLLEENIFTYVSEKLNLGWKTEKEREIVSSCFAIAKYEDLLNNEKSWNLHLPKEATGQEQADKRALFKSIISNDIFQKFLDVYKSISSLRNDYNHAGMSDKAALSTSVMAQIKIKVNNVFAIINELEQLNLYVD